MPEIELVRKNGFPPAWPPVGVVSEPEGYGVGLPGTARCDPCVGLIARILIRPGTVLRAGFPSLSAPHLLVCEWQMTSNGHLLIKLPTEASGKNRGPHAVEAFKAFLLFCAWGPAQGATRQPRPSTRVFPGL